MKRAHADLALLLVLVAGVQAWSGPAHGQGATHAGATIAPSQAVVASAAQPAPWKAVSDEQLDAMRGGFDFGNGLLASFGIDRVVYINGNLVAQSSVNIPNIAGMTAVQASALATVTGNVSVVQNGVGNSFAPAMLDRTTAAMVIQNSLNNQDIKSLTTINASVNNLGQFSSSRLAESLQSALIGSLGH